ncbi:MAG: hypothetical protein V1851_02235 [Patescibacteria group bacterium]
MTKKLKTYGEGRRCFNCGCVLSSYNSLSICDPCRQKDKVLFFGIIPCRLSEIGGKRIYPRVVYGGSPNVW